MTSPAKPAAASQAELKRLVGEAALAYVEPGSILGVGTGSTVNCFIDALATLAGGVAGAVSSSEAILQWTIDYVSERKIFGNALATFQNTQFKLAEVKAQVTVSRAFIDRCIELHLGNNLDPVDAAIAKMTATEQQGRIVDECLQFFGGYGYMSEYPIARAYADARMSRIAGGSSEVMKHIIGRSLLGRASGAKLRSSNFA